MTDIIAHRGASARIRENTVAAFELAVALGSDGIELDVRRTLDGRAAVHHDPHLPDGRLIHQVAALDLPPEVPLLDTALEACGDLMVNIEIKNLPIEPDYDPGQTMAEMVGATVESLGIQPRIVVSSFGFDAIARTRVLTPDLRTAWLVIPSAIPPAELVERTAGAGHAGLHPLWTMVDDDLVARAHDAGLFVNVWTVDDSEQIRRLADLGVDGIVTNVPDVAREALGRA